MDKNQLIVKTKKTLSEHLKGHRVIMDLTSVNIDSCTWKATGDLTISISLDTENWATVKSSVQGYDKTSDLAMAVVSLALNNYTSSDEFILALGEQLFKDE